MHPMAGILQAQLGQAPQMGDIFGDVLKNLETSIKTGGTKAANDAIASTAKSILGDPVVQQAVIESGNDTAIQKLAAQLKAAQKSTYQAVTANPMTSAAIALGGLVLVGFVGYLIVRGASK